MVNYFKILNRFWDEAPYQVGYKGDHATLFFAIVDSINRNNWRDTDIEYDRLINKVRLGKKNYLDCRAWLVLHQFITLKPGRGDYAKARFGLVGAVSNRTASSTLPAPAKESDAVSDAVPHSTASDTAQIGDAVSDRTASDTAIDTASGTASGTASDTYLIKEPITTNHLPITQQQQQSDSQKSESGDGGGGDVEKADLSEQKKEERNTPPTPPLLSPTAEDIRLELVKSAPHRRYAMEQLKIAKSDTDYAELIEIYITQQEAQADDTHPAFLSIRDARRHFMNWLGKRPEINSSNSITVNNGSNHKGRTGTLRPTSIGKPDYRGTGSDCELEL